MMRRLRRNGKLGVGAMLFVAFVLGSFGACFLRADNCPFGCTRITYLLSSGGDVCYRFGNTQAYNINSNTGVDTLKTAQDGDGTKTVKNMTSIAASAAQPAPKT